MPGGRGQLPNTAGQGERPTYRIKLFNPGSNRSVRSVLRLVNPRARQVEATIEGLDALAEPGEGRIKVEIPARGAASPSPSGVRSLVVAPQQW